jgi:opacity protein-like surface antigen
MMICAAAAAFGASAAQLSPGEIDFSAFAHSIHQGADAHSQIFETRFGVTPKLGITTEFVSIEDVDGSTNIGNVYLSSPIQTRYSKKMTVAGYAGLTWFAVDERFGGQKDKTGLSIGAAADYRIRPELTVYSRGTVAFLEKSLWTLDLGMQYEVRPKWNITMGYRGYDVDGSSIGGFVVGATYSVTK